MGVNTDGEEIGPGSTVTDGVELTVEACEVVQETENEKSLIQDADDDVGIQEREPAKEADIPLIPFPKMPSQSSVPNTEHKEAQREHADEGDSFLSNTTTTLQSDAHRKDGNGELSRGAPVSLYADSFADDTCNPLEECTSPLQPAEIMDSLETDAYDTSDAMYKTLLDGISPSDVSAFKLELPFNHDIDQMDQEGYTPLYKAALEGQLEGVQDLISRGANPNKPSKGGLRPLHAAAHEGHLHIVDLLILQGADVNEEDETGNTPLIHAASGGHVKVMEYLIQQGYDVNKADAKGWTPFNAAVQNGHLEAVKCLVTKGAKQNRYGGVTPLYAAAQSGHLDIVKFFIDKGADVNEVNQRGHIPFHGAAVRGHMEVMAYLIQQGSDVNTESNTGWTPFNAAIQYGHLEAVKYLMTKGVKQNRYFGMTPLYAATQCGHLDIVKFFIDKGADVNKKSDKGRILLHGAASGGHVEVMEYLIQQGSDVNTEDNTGWTPFNAAVQCGHLEVIKYLLTKGVEQNRNAGMTPLYSAAGFGHLDIVKFLISEGADVNEEADDGMIPLHAAVANGYKEIMEYLIHQGSNVNKEDAVGGTPFNAAVQCGNLEVVKYLITQGAIQNIFQGKHQLYGAAKLGHLDLVKYFISKGADVNIENDEGMIPLHGAAFDGNIEIIEYLIHQGSIVNKEDAKGGTPFNAAVQYGNLEAVKYLMTQGAKQNRYDGMTPLYAAARFGHLDIVKFFISSGAVVNEEQDSGMIPLHGAASGGHLEVMEYLIQQGSDVNKADAKGWTPFNAAIQYGHLQAVKNLMNEGTKQNRYDGMTPVYAAAYFGQSHIVKFFIDKGANVNKADDKGMIPLHGAASGGHSKVMEYLIQQGSDVNKNDCRGWTPFHAAVKNGHLEVVEFLMAKGAKVNRLNGLTPLYIATQYDHVDVVNFLVTGGYDVNERNECGKSPLHAACYNGNMDIVKVLIHHNANVNEQDQDGWTPLHAAAQEGHQNIVDYLALHGSDMQVRDIDGLTPLRAAANTTHPHVIEGTSPSRGDPDDEGKGGPRSGGHQNITTRGYVTVSLKDADTQLRIGQLATRIYSVEGSNYCKQADIAKRGAGELSLKNLPTRTHGDEKDGNGEHNPFIHAKLKFPDKGEQDPTPDQMEATKIPETRKKDTITNDTDCSSPRVLQTWEYSGFDPPFLQTMEAGGHQSEEPESRCHSLIDENREMRESSSHVNAGNDLPIDETSDKFESFPTPPPAVAQQKWYDGDPAPIQGTSSNQGWKIGTKRRTSVDRCSSIPALVQTFLQMIIALAIILAGSPVLVAGSSITERVTLQAGKPGVVPFHLSLSPSNTSQIVPFYTLQLKSKPRPFCNNGKSDIEGFKSSSQLPRFTTSVTDLDTSLCVNLMIDNVDTLDEGVYVLTAFWHSFENVRYETIMKEIVVQIPPGRAKCFITLSENSDYPYEAHCRAPTGSVTTTLSCYQNDRKIDIRGNITDNGLITRGIFWLLDYTHFSCCSHDVTLHVNETTCNDFEWPSIKETTRQIVNTVPTSVTTPTPQIESHTESGACRQFMLPSLWHFTYLFIYIIAFVTMY